MNYPSLSLSQASIENVFATEGSKEQVQSDHTATGIYRPNIKRVLSRTKHRNYLCIDSNEDKAFQKHSTLKEKFANKSFTEQFANNEVQKCDECEYKTSIQEQMREHMLIKHSGIKHKCPQCEYTHYYPNRVKRHENHTHKKIPWISGKKSMLCNNITCPLFGSNECKELDLHGRHKCAECNFATRRLNDLKTHIGSVHEGEIYHRCAECNFVTKRLHDLNRHIGSMHEGEIYRCDECQYFSKTKRDLKNHIHSKHANIRKKPAKITRKWSMLCNSPGCPQFGSNECKELKLHGRHKCSECDFVAKRSSNLSKHVRNVHDGVVYHCEKCQFHSKSKYYLAIHIQSKHEGIVFPCDHCEFLAQRKRQLKNHMNTAHKNLLQSEISSPCLEFKEAKTMHTHKVHDESKDLSQVSNLKPPSPFFSCEEMKYI